MKKLIIILVFALLFPFLNTFPQGNPDFGFLNSLYYNGEYFKFYNGYISNSGKFNDFEILYLSALCKGKLNIPEESNKAINELFASHKDKLTDSMKMELYKAKYINLSNLYLYSEALEAGMEIINKYASLITPQEVEDFKDDVDFLEAIKDAPPMRILQKKESKLKVFRDLAGLINVPVVISDTGRNFVFDTGANFSVITEGLAQKIGLNPGNKKFKCGTATGKKIDASTAVSGEFRIGDCILKNVIFIILPDKDLTFGPFYKIEGIIGAPVMMALGEFQIRNFSEMTIPSVASDTGNPNFFFSEYLPVMNVVNENDSLVFIFDSGAQTSSLYSLYFKNHKEEITSKYKPEKITLGGAGSMITTDCYNLKEFNLKSGEYSVTIPKISVIVEKLSESEALLHGRIGQDFFKNAGQIIINFEKMTLTVR